MGRDLKKGIKRFLKRRVKITLGFIVAFLLSCSFVMGEGLEITQDGNGKILFNGEIFDEETHQFIGNSFDGNTYINTNILKIEAENDIGNAVYIDVNKNDFTFINNGVINSYTKYTKQDKSPLGYGIYIQNQIKKIENNGNIISKIENNYFQNGENNGIFISGDSEEIKNNGIIQSEFLGENKGWLTSNNGITVFSDAGDIINNGLILSVLNEYKNNVTSAGISIALELDENNKFSKCGKVYEINNTGIIHTKGNETGTIWNNGEVNLLENKGNISSYWDKDQNFDIAAIYSSPFYENIIPTINNYGKILSINLKGNSLALSGEIGKIENNGLIYSKGNKSSAIYSSATNKEDLINMGTIISISEDNDGFGLSFYGSTSENLANYGVISADIPVQYYEQTKMENFGLFMSENGKILNFDNQSQKFTVETSKTESSTEIADIGKTVINAGSNEQGFAQSIKSETIRDLSADTGYILNSYDKTVVLNSATESKDINNSVINAVINAVTFEGDNLTLGLNNTTVNGGYGEDIISGDDNVNNLNFSGETVINGNVNLNGGNDKLSLNNTVQINGILDGGAGDGDILTFNSSVTKSSSDKNINILYNIKGFEKTDIDTNVTLFEKTVGDNGDVKNLVAGLGDITIQNNGKLTLRVDGTEKEGDKITGHALYENKGSLQTSETGKLVLGLYGVGNEAVVAFGGTKIENLNSDNVETSSYLHSVKVNGSENVIEVSAKKDLEDLDIANYDKLNKIYHSILNSENTDKFTVEEEQKGEFFKYLHDIYAGNPYAYSSELSRKTMDMMRNLTDRDLHPEINKWSIYGGLSHVDGGTKESFYGRNYYGYDTGSRDIETDTKITGGYFKAEYGKSDSITTGIIFGGNNAESEIGNSKVEGDSFYFGGYAKKFVNDFKFTLGAGFQHGDYKADRTAVGYEGITTTRSYSENYHDRGFDIYGDIRYSREIGDNLFFEPSFTLSYTYLDQDSAAENGTLAIETDSKNFDYLSSEINLDVRKTILADKLTHSFIAGISYERLLNGYDEEYITGRVIGGTDFDILVPAKEKDNFLLNAKYELETEKGMLFDLKYSYRFEHDNNQDEWTVGAGVGYKF